TRARAASRSSVPFLLGQTSSRRGFSGCSSIFMLCPWRPGVPARLDGRDARPPSTKLYRWHVEQLVMSVTVRNLYFFTRSVTREIWSVYSLPSNSTGLLLDGCSERILKTWSRGRRFFSGARWHSRHHSICSEAWLYISGMRSTGPWQVLQPTPLLI